jgi:phosphoribosylamine--glycine ligase
MKVLLIGSGGREHALAQAILRSDGLTSLAVAPGNAGTQAHNVVLDVTENAAVVDYCASNQIDLVVVGPEAPLVAGLADALVDADISCFGPSQAAARLEGSKSFTRSFADTCNIPSPLSKTFTSSVDAIAWFDAQPFEVVVKADGLAAGKGVIIPESRDQTVQAITSMIDGGVLGESGSTIVLEERMTGEELSLFGVSDGSTVIALATAQDHKRVGEGDTGPNTGGMGAFSPVPGIDAARQAELAALFLEPAIAGMAAAGTPYVGVLFAGIMVTPTGPKLVEYNCRFGDPEAEVILPMLQSSGLELMAAAANGTLDQVSVTMRPGVAATVVVCAQGYPADPARGIAVPDLGCSDDVCTFYAGAVRDADNHLVSSGGRVLAITGMGDDLDLALSNSYRLVDQITGNGLFARGDIGWRYSSVRSSKSNTSSDN